MSQALGLPRRPLIALRSLSVQTHMLQDRNVQMHFVNPRDTLEAPLLKHQITFVIQVTLLIMHMSIG